MDNKYYIISIDQGTTGSKVILFDNNERIVDMLYSEVTQYYENPTYVEHDAIEIYESIKNMLLDIVERNNIDISLIKGIGITNQRETTVVFDKDGMPICKAICWQCRRTAPICEKIVEDGFSGYIKENTGLNVDAYFSATKLKWILENVKGAKEKAENNEIYFGTIDTYLLYRLTENTVFATDRTNASRTMLYNIKNLDWDDKILDYFGINKEMLPTVHGSAHYFGETSLFGENVPIVAMAGDQQSALYGQDCIKKNMAKCTYGTGCFLLMNIGEDMALSKNGLLTSIAATDDDNVEYILEGSVFSGGCVVQWVRDELGLIKSSKESEDSAMMVKSTEGVYLVPAFTGLGTPYWDMYAKGLITGITRGTNKHHIVRAALESIAFQVEDVLEAMKKDTSLDIEELKVDGGASQNGFLMQFQADISDIEIVANEVSEITALGVCKLAKKTLNLADLPYEKKYRNFYPKMDSSKREESLNGYRDAVRRCITKEE